MARRRVRAGMHDDIVRVMQGLSIGNVQETTKRDKRARELGLRELEQQFQIPVAGSAGTVIDWDTTSCDFDYPFYFAPGARDSDLDAPQMVYGAVIESGSPVVIAACVTGWKQDATDDSYIGATVALGAFSPGAVEAVAFGGSVHVSFQGYGALLEDETEMT